MLTTTFRILVLSDDEVYDVPESSTQYGNEVYASYPSVEEIERVITECKGNAAEVVTRYRLATQHSDN